MCIRDSPYTVGGGFRDLTGMRTMVAAGADKVSINSAAVRDPDLITRAAAAFGSQAVIVAIDAKRVGKPGAPGADRWEVYLAGGRTPTGIDAVAWAEEAARRGAGAVSYTHLDVYKRQPMPDADACAWRPSTRASRAPGTRSAA